MVDHPSPSTLSPLTERKKPYQPHYLSYGAKVGGSPNDRYHNYLRSPMLNEALNSQELTDILKTVKRIMNYA